MMPGVWYLPASSARALVLAGNITELLALHRAGEISVSPALDYAARRGRARITQALVAEGVTVTRVAIQSAARRGGPGLELLLRGLRGNALERARSDALHSLLQDGQFERALALLEQGVTVTARCYTALECGSTSAIADGRAFPPHDVLKMLLSVTPTDQFTTDTLGVIVTLGRPIHIERVLETLGQPPLFLLVPAIIRRANQAITTLRRMGLRMSNEGFIQTTEELVRRNCGYASSLDPLVGMYLEDLGPVMPAPVAEPALLILLRECMPVLRQIAHRHDASYQYAEALLQPLTRCVRTDEHLKLSEVIDRWAAAENVPVPVAAVLKQAIHVAHQSAMMQSTCEAVTP